MTDLTLDGLGSKDIAGKLEAEKAEMMGEPVSPSKECLEERIQTAQMRQEMTNGALSYAKKPTTGEEDLKYSLRLGKSGTWSRIKGKLSVLGLMSASLVATPALDAAESAYNAFFRDQSRIEFAKPAYAEEWRYATLGNKVPTPEQLITDGYKCLNCANPKIIKPFSGRQNLEVQFIAYKKDNMLVGLYLLPNGKCYGFQERDLVKDKDIWCYDEDSQGLVSKVNKDAGGEFRIKLEKYGF